MSVYILDCAVWMLDCAAVFRWVPELENVPTKHIHAPWEAPPNLLLKHGVVLGETYPIRVTSGKSLTELRVANVRALRAARSRRKEQHPEDIEWDEYDAIQVPEGAATGVKGNRVRVLTIPSLRRPEEEEEISLEYSSLTTASTNRKNTLIGQN